MEKKRFSDRFTAGMFMRIFPRTFSSARIIILGFAGVILLGTLALMLPFSTRGEGGASFFDALFTAVSAVCVTGLVVQDTAAYWSPFGQGVLLLLIQIGGLGVVSVAVAVSAFTGHKIGLMERSTMQDAVSAPQMGGIVRFLRFILKVTLAVELLGALLLAVVFLPEFGVKGIWYSVFHAVSAFCNAGFDLMGIRGEFSSLTSYSGNLLLNLVIMLLIVGGGLGFLTWRDICSHKWHISKYRAQSKLILAVTVMLILLPAVFFYCMEFTGSGSGTQRLLASVFQSVTARTAGFNTADLSSMSDSGKLIMAMLMLTGGSPGSTAGGIKTTSVAVMYLAVFAVIRRKEDVQAFGRRIPLESLVNAWTVFLMYFTLFLGGGVIISCVEHLPLLTAVFETASAIGTVGVTLGITPGLSAVSKVILILLMFLGRVGALTVIFAAVPIKRAALSKLPEEKIMVG